MKNEKSHTLDGKNNKRLNNITEVHSEVTAARTNIQKEASNTHVNIPNLNSVVNSKEWVDNGSRL